MFYGFDPVYFIFAIPGLILAGIASAMTHGTFKKYSKVATRSGMTGAEAARRMLDKNGLQNVTIRESHGFLSDHYNPLDRSLNLSANVYHSNSLSAIGVACHEAGHAMQHAENYAPLKMRSAMVPVTQFSSYGSYIFIMVGMLFSSMAFAKFGVILFSVGVLFSITTLPVEWDASARAKHQMVTCGIVTDNEANDSGKVLNAAFLTYIAAAISSLLTLLYYLMRLGLLGGNDD